MPDVNNTSPDADPIAAYETAIAGLASMPDDRELQHKAVLALARAGSLRFARAEYQRYGLDKVRHHEDIMALGGRLYKDLYQGTFGKDALEYARKSAELYEAAFQSTGGFYSGVNAATMALLADMPTDIVQDRARAILSRLPDLDSQSLTQRYYIEATRAEAYLLLGDLAQSETGLRGAVAHDPLNYTAHASTLRQFRLIAQKRGFDIAWLDALDPPKAAHFAGHISAKGGQALNEVQVSALKIDISDRVQSQDVGFAFGALAAGSDIILAETMLEDGAALHVILPIPRDNFSSQSIQPFGNDWQARFDACINAARRVTIVFPSLKTLSGPANRLAAQVAMGQAILQAGHLDSRAVQLLIWDGQGGASQTAAHAEDWVDSGGGHIYIDYPAARKKTSRSKASQSLDVLICLSRSDDPAIAKFDSLVDAVDAGQKLRDADPSIQIGLDLGLADQASEIELIAAALCGAALPGSLFLSERAASILALTDMATYAPSYAGQVEGPDGSSLRAFSLT